MRYFTQEWASGELEDQVWQDALDAYREGLSHADGPVSYFATAISLNDAYLDRAEFNRALGELRLLLLTGDNQVGYWRTILIYSGAQIEGEDVLRFGLSARPSEIWYDEFDVAPERLRHSFLLAPNPGNGSLRSAGEFAISFDGFQFSQERAAGRMLSTPEDCSIWV